MSRGDAAPHRATLVMRLGDERFEHPEMAAKVPNKGERCAALSWLFDSYSCNPKITTTISPAVILDSSLNFMRSWAVVMCCQQSY